MSRVSLIVGLGNPGSEYEKTRHNAGFWFLDELARQQNVSFKSEKKFHGEVARYKHAGDDVWLLLGSGLLKSQGDPKNPSYMFLHLTDVFYSHNLHILSFDVRCSFFCRLHKKREMSFDISLLLISSFVTED